MVKIPSVAVVSDYGVPLKMQLCAPFYAIAQECKQLKACWHNNTQENCVNAVRAFARLAFSFGLTFAYRCAWHLGEHHFGPLGGLGASAVLYELASYLDPRIDYISSSAWLFYKGFSGVLKHSGSNPWDWFCLLLLMSRNANDFKSSPFFENAYVEPRVTWLASWFSSNPPVRPETTKH
jgi:hypothetical protein